MEIAALTDRSLKMFNEIVLSTDAGRFCRPIKHLALNATEWVCPIEQAYMNVAVREDEILPETTHIEIDPRYLLDILAACTPFSDSNQSCRNMYQCQMLKQTMGTFCHNMPYRVDNKVYRLQTPQTPISHTDTYKKFDLDEYSTGTNTVVCVTAYTGYDMEDAMIVCRGAMQRGFKHGSVYKTEHISLIEDSRRGEVVLKRFTNTDPVTGELKCKTLPPDGVPIIGMRMDHGTPMYAYINENTGRIRVVPYKHHEPCYIEEVRLVGSDSGMLQKISVKLRYNRNPILGDKFASRAGQKGTLGMLIPQENMPFTEFGLVPDLIINPHAFPSRMTIGMMNESIVGKYASMKAEFMDASSFNWNEKKKLVSHYGAKLLEYGFNFYGSEPLYSGMTGVEMHGDIYIGLVYYQRLRHMISDKYQVRATGPIDQLTKQPIKGRKRGGGIRFGEMERDSLIAHGAPYMMQDRLMNCSDASSRLVCKNCGSILSVTIEAGAGSCLVCKEKGDIKLILLPFVFVYMTNELAAM